MPRRAARHGRSCGGGRWVVVDKAGLSLSKPLLETTKADWDLQHDVMAKSSSLVSRAAVRGLIDQKLGGDIVHLSSKRTWPHGTAVRPRNRQSTGICGPQYHFGLTLSVAVKKSRPERKQRNMAERRIPKVRDFTPLMQFKKPEFNARRRRLAAATSIYDLRTIAKRVTPRAAFDYTDGAAEGEISLARARQAFQDIEFHPSVLR